MHKSACGLFDCTKCTHSSRGRCPGCTDANNQIAANGGVLCAVHRCALSNNAPSCLDCNALVCQMPRSLETLQPVRADFEKKRCYIRKFHEFFSRRASNGEPDISRMPGDKTITRLRSYLFAINELLANGARNASSEDISRKVGIKDYLIRRDLSQFGGFGRPSIGYDAQYLHDRLAHILNIDRPKNAIWIGAPVLASNRTLSQRMKTHGFNVVGVFDDNPTAGLTEVDGLPVQPISMAETVIRENEVRGAILAVAESQAQPIADILVKAGIKGILTLGPAIIVTPPSVCVRHVDIVAEMCSLSYYCATMHDSAIQEKSHSDG